MSKGHYVKIVTPKFGLTDTQVFIDGKEVDRVFSVTFTASVDSCPVVTIEFCPGSVEIEGEVIVKQVK